MKKINLQIIPTHLLEQYYKQVDKKLSNQFEQLKDAEISTKIFSFYTSVSAIASSRIEGEKMEVDSYIKYKILSISPTLFKSQIIYTKSICMHRKMN